MARPRSLVLPFAAAFLAIATWNAPAQSPPPDAVKQGRFIWEAQCASCHGPTATGGRDGPPILEAGPAGVDFMLSSGRMPLATPDRQPERRTAQLDPSETRAVVAFLTAIGLRGPDIPHISLEAGDVTHGQALFQENCAACHGAAAAGGSVGGGRVAPSLYEPTPLEIAEAIRVGPGTMPPFGEEVLSQSDLDALLRYILFLRSESDDGGLGLGRNGPVAEGFIAWFVGLGVLLLVTRFVGTRT